MIVDVPATIPFTRPVPAPIDAVPGALLLHVPPAVTSESNVVKPTHTARLPSIGVGLGFTVTTAVMAVVGYEHALLPPSARK